MINPNRKKQETELNLNPVELMRAGHYFELAQDYVERAKIDRSFSCLKDSLLSLKYFFETIERFSLQMFDSYFYERMGDNLLMLHEDLTRCGLANEAKMSGSLAKKCYDISSLKRGIIL